MKGYKGTDRNMQCRGFQYKVGKTYEAEGDPIMCKNGFHFCVNLPDVFAYYDYGKDNRYFEVEADDDAIAIGDDKCATARIRIVRELSVKEVSRGRYGDGYGDGDGYGNGDGDGDGNGYGDGDGYGNGYGDGYGNGYGYGNC